MVRVMGQGLGTQLANPQDNPEDSDADLVRLAGRGDRIAASALIVRHADKVLAVCVRMLGNRAAAEDATQETFLRLWKNADRWEPKGAKFETWLIRIAMNYCLDQLRKSGREVNTEEMPEPVDPAPRQDDYMLQQDRQRTVDEALAVLPTRQRQALILSYFQELTNIEGAQIMDVSVDAFESLLSRGRRSLRKKLDPVGLTILSGGVA